MRESIQDNKYVELTYRIVDRKTGHILTTVEFPLNYVHGANPVLSPQVTTELAGKSTGDRIEVPIDCDQLYGARDESLVITDYIKNVPEEYREIGTTIVMENDKGETMKFVVTRIDGETMTFDGNNPLSGREVLFQLEVLQVRDATDEEIEAGGKPEPAPAIRV